jgi:endonuclease V-like protein UPF0215 family
MNGLANGFEELLQFLAIGQPAAHSFNPRMADADLTRASARVRHLRKQHQPVPVSLQRIRLYLRATSVLAEEAELLLRDFVFRFSNPEPSAYVL